MNTLTYGTYRDHESKNEGIIARAITRILEAWKTSYQRDSAATQHRSFVEQNLLDPNVGPEIARTMR